MTPEERQQGYNTISNTKEWVMNANEVQKTLPKTEPLAITGPQVKDKIK